MRTMLLGLVAVSAIAIATPVAPDQGNTALKS